LSWYKISYSPSMLIWNFIKVRLYFIEIWRYNDFRDGGRPPFWIFKVWKVVAFDRHYRRILHHIQNFCENRKSAADLKLTTTFSSMYSPSAILKWSIFSRKIFVFVIDLIWRTIQNSINIWLCFTEILRRYITIFKMAVIHNSGFSKFKFFIFLLLLLSDFKYSYKMSLKLDNAIWRPSSILNN